MSIDSPPCGGGCAARLLQPEQVIRRHCSPCTTHDTIVTATQRQHSLVYKTQARQHSELYSDVATTTTRNGHQEGPLRRSRGSNDSDDSNRPVPLWTAHAPSPCRWHPLSEYPSTLPPCLPAEPLAATWVHNRMSTVRQAHFHPDFGTMHGNSTPQNSTTHAYPHFPFRPQ